MLKYIVARNVLYRISINFDENEIVVVKMISEVQEINPSRDVADICG